MIKDNRKFEPLVYFFVGLLVTSLSVLLLILPESYFYVIPLSREMMAGIILMLLGIGTFVLPGIGFILAILVIFRFRALLLAIFEMVLNLAIPVVVLSFKMF